MPLNNRIAHVTAELDAPGLIEKMKQWNWDTRLVAFLTLRPAEIHNMPAEGKERKKNGTTPYGEDHGKSKLTNETVLAIRNATGSQRHIARKFGISQATVYQIKTRKAW